MLRRAEHSVVRWSEYSNTQERMRTKRRIVEEPRAATVALELMLRIHAHTHTSTYIRTRTHIYTFTD